MTPVGETILLVHSTRGPFRKYELEIHDRRPLEKVANVDGVAREIASKTTYSSFVGIFKSLIIDDSNESTLGI